MKMFERLYRPVTDRLMFQVDKCREIYTRAWVQGGGAHIWPESVMASGRPAAGDLEDSDEDDKGMDGKVGGHMKVWGAPFDSSDDGFGEDVDVEQEVPEVKASKKRGVRSAPATRKKTKRSSRKRQRSKTKELTLTLDGFDVKAMSVLGRFVRVPVYKFGKGWAKDNYDHFSSAVAHGWIKEVDAEKKKEQFAVETLHARQEKHVLLLDPWEIEKWIMNECVTAACVDMDTPPKKGSELDMVSV